MRRQEFQCKERAVWEDLLSTVKIGHIAFRRGENLEILPYNFSYLHEHLYFHCSPQTGLAGAVGGPAKFLAYHEVAWIPSTWRHPHLACPATTYFTSLTLSGRLIAVESLKEKAEALEQFMQKYQPDQAYTPLSDKRYHGPLSALFVLKLKVESPVLKRKMGQHLTPQQREKVYDGLRTRALLGDRVVAQAMAESNDESDPQGWVESLNPAQLTNLVKLISKSYWAEGRSLSEQANLNQSSQLLLAKCDSQKLLAFARVTWVTPRVAYLADVIVSPEARGKGLGKALMARVMNHPRLRKTPKVILHTKDAQSFYAQFGFREKHGDENSFMERQLH